VVEVDGRRAPERAGRFETFARGAHSFTIAIGACARVGSNGRVFEAIREADPALYLVTGDLFYADIGENDPDRFRERYREALTQPAQAALYRSTPVAYIWDDHDYGPNDSDRTAESRPAAHAAYREIVPRYDLAADEPRGAIYQAFTIGRVRFILTDARSERDPAGQAMGEPRSMLGPEQKAWLKQELLDARGTFPLIVWVSPVPWIGAARSGADS
jgi:phosphodiesterase/alkaline phosphatase D-like protein